MPAYGKNAIRGSSHHTRTFSPATNAKPVISALFTPSGYAARPAEPQHLGTVHLGTLARYCVPGLPRFCFATIAATSASSCFAS